MADRSLQSADKANALRACRDALRRVAEYTLDPVLDNRLLDLGERKEFLDAGEYEELMALVAFTQQRTLEKLKAELALRQLHSVYPDLESASSLEEQSL